MGGFWTNGQPSDRALELFHWVFTFTQNQIYPGFFSDAFIIGSARGQVYFDSGQ